jgi:AraC family transcriptional regulator
MPRTDAIDDAEAVAHHLLRRQVGEFRTVHNSFPARYELGEHEHAQATVYLVVRGSHVERSRSGDIDCTAGSVVFSPAGARHSDHYGNTGGQAFLVVIPQRLLEHALEAGIRLDEPRHAAFGVAPELMQRMREELRREDAVTPFAFEALAMQLLAVLHREEPCTSPRAPRWLVRVRELLTDRFADPLSLVDVAAVAGVHPIHLATTFRRCYGTTVGAYVRAVRIERARQALQTSAHSIAEIALACGFADQSHFSRVFRDATGTTPGRYRRTSRPAEP